jgi:hypothetical protein
MEQDYGGDTE